MNRKGFTLIEMLVVFSIIAMILLVLARYAPRAVADHRISRAAATLQADIIDARQAARSEYRGKPERVVGLRLLPDPQWDLVKLADGTIDRTAPIAYARTVPLIETEQYRTGYIALHTDGWPAGFTPAYGRLVLEQSPVDADGLRCEPTTWFWLVRVGDVVTLRGRDYTVCGPTLVPFGPANPDGFVNWGWPGAVSPLDRGAGPMEWLYLTNRADDDRDGYTDEGWDGMDSDLDGYVDEDDEWETELWHNIPAEGLMAAPYAIKRRPVEDDVRSGGDVASETIPASPIVVDGRKTWLPMNPYTGAVDVIFDELGLASSPSIYGRPNSLPMGVNTLHLWLCGRQDVTAEPDADFPAKVVSLHLPTGRVSAGDGNPTDVAGTLARLEGR